MKGRMPTSPYLKHYLSGRLEDGRTDDLPTLEVLEEEYIGYVIELSGFDLARSAKILGLPTAELLRRIKRLEIRL